MVLNERAGRWKLEAGRWKEGLSIPEKNRDGNVRMTTCKTEKVTPPKGGITFYTYTAGNNSSRISCLNFHLLITNEIFFAVAPDINFAI
jgi:hypothetical protein